MAGVEIGDGSVVGANAVVTKSVEPYQIVGGNPAKLIRHRFDETTRVALLESRWWDKDLNELSKLDCTNIEQFAKDAAAIFKPGCYKAVRIKERKVYPVSP